MFVYLHFDGSWSLVSYVLKSGCDINLLGSFCHPGQHHVNQDVGPSTTHTIAAVDYDGTGFATIGFVHLPSELQESFGRWWDTILRPGQEVELGHRPRLLSLSVLEIEAPDQVVITPHMLRDKVDLVEVVASTALSWPVQVMDGVGIRHGCKVDDDNNTLLPNHLRKKNVNKISVKVSFN